MLFNSPTSFGVWGLDFNLLSLMNSPYTPHTLVHLVLVRLVRLLLILSSLLLYSLALLSSYKLHLLSESLSLLAITITTKVFKSVKSAWLSFKLSIAHRTEKLA